MNTTNSQDRIITQAEEQQEEVERWSEAAIHQRRLENLRKARESLKKKREDNIEPMKQPFSLTPVTRENLPITPRADVEVTNERSSGFASNLWDVFYGVSTHTLLAIISVAVPLMVSSYFAPNPQPVPVNPSISDDREKNSPPSHLYNGQSIFMER